MEGWDMWLLCPWNLPSTHMVYFLLQQDHDGSGHDKNAFDMARGTRASYCYQEYLQSSGHSLNFVHRLLIYPGTGFTWLPGRWGTNLHDGHEIGREYTVGYLDHVLLVSNPPEHPRTVFYPWTALPWLWGPLLQFLLYLLLIGSDGPAHWGIWDISRKVLHRHGITGWSAIYCVVSMGYVVTVDERAGNPCALETKAHCQWIFEVIKTERLLRTGRHQLTPQTTNLSKWLYPETDEVTQISIRLFSRSYIARWLII